MAASNQDQAERRGRTQNSSGSGSLSTVRQSSLPPQIQANSFLHPFYNFENTSCVEISDHSPQDGGYPRPSLRRLSTPGDFAPNLRPSLDMSKNYQFLSSPVNPAHDSFCATPITDHGLNFEIPSGQAPYQLPHTPVSQNDGTTSKAPFLSDSTDMFSLHGVVTPQEAEFSNMSFNSGSNFDSAQIGLGPTDLRYNGSSFENAPNLADTIGIGGLNPQATPFVPITQSFNPGQPAFAQPSNLDFSFYTPQSYGSPYGCGNTVTSVGYESSYNHNTGGRHHNGHGFMPSVGVGGYQTNGYMPPPPSHGQRNYLQNNPLFGLGVALQPNPTAFIPGSPVPSSGQKWHLAQPRTNPAVSYPVEQPPMLPSQQGQHQLYRTDGLQIYLTEPTQPPPPLLSEAAATPLERKALRANQHANAHDFNVGWDEKDGKIRCLHCTNKMYGSMSAWKKHAESQGYIFICPSPTCSHRPNRLDNLKAHIAKAHPNMPPMNRLQIQRQLRSLLILRQSIFAPPGARANAQARPLSGSEAV